MVADGITPSVIDQSLFPPLSTSRKTTVAVRTDPVNETPNPLYEADKALSRASYATALRPLSPRASKKTFEGVGQDFKSAIIYNNKPGIFYTEDEVSSLAKPFEFSLIGKFSGSRPPYAVVLQAFRNLGLSSSFNIRFLRSGYVFLHLTSSEDMARVWIRGVWFIGGVPLRIFRWTPYFSYTAESSVVPVWIRLPDLPIHMFSKATLFSAASIIGKPIKIDEATADCSRLSVARVCVEIDLLKPKVEDFWIGIGEEKRLQRVEYEKHPSYCVKCWHLGHSEEECHASGNNVKSAGGGSVLGPRLDWKDLREKLNKGNEAITEKVDSEFHIEALDVNVQRVEKQVWIQKKGVSKEQVTNSNNIKAQGNSFNCLTDLEEQAVADVDSGCRGDMGELEEKHELAEKNLEFEEQKLDELDAHLVADLDPVPAINQDKTLKTGIRKGKTVVGFLEKKVGQQAVKVNRGGTLVQNQEVAILKESTGSKLAVQVPFGKGQSVINPGQKFPTGGCVAAIQNQSRPTGLAGIQEMEENASYMTEVYAIGGSGISDMVGGNLNDEVDRNDASKSFEEEDDYEYGEAVDLQRSLSFPLASNVKDPLWKASTTNIPPGVSRMVTRSKAQEFWNH